MKTFLALMLGLASALLFAWGAGESPGLILSVFWNSVFGSVYDFGMCLAYTTPLIFTGLSVALLFRIGLFNVGAEGQLAMGALGATAFGLQFPLLPWYLALPGGTLAGFLLAGLWGIVPGWILAKRGGHEVISTIMLNFIASSVCGYLLLGHLRNPDSSNPESAVLSPNYHLSSWSLFPNGQVNVSLVIAVICCLLAWLVLEKTTLGFRIRSLGSNPSAALTAGYSVPRMQILMFGLAGGLAGLVAVPEVFGNSHRFVLGFSSDLGFTGIAVALLVGAQPLAIIPSAFLFGCLQKGALDLEFQSEIITRDLALVLRALILLSVIVVGALPFFRRKL